MGLLMVQDHSNRCEAVVQHSWQEVPGGLYKVPSEGAMGWRGRRSSSDHLWRHLCPQCPQVSQSGSGEEQGGLDLESGESGQVDFPGDGDKPPN